MATKTSTPKIDPKFVPGSSVPAASAVKTLIEGYSWTATAGQAKNISYSFSQATGPSDSGLSGGQATLNGTQQGQVESALQAWANVANVTFSETTGTANINVRLANMPSSVAGWMAPSTSSQTQLSHADVVMDHAYSDMDVGSYAYMAVMHELGHALGLKHPGNYNGSGEGTGPFLAKAQDSHDYSIMSYSDGKYTNSWTHNPETPMIYDIAAMQFLYGANHSYNSGNTSYDYDGSSHVLTIWDGAGTDTINASSTSSNNTIDLREGISNVTTIGYTNLWVAFGANIENATGGSGNDTLYGNALANVLTGNGGNDTLIGDVGNDTLIGGSGINKLDGGKGDDSFTITGNDSVIGGDGNDTMNASGDLLATKMDGGAGNDNITGGSAADSIIGGAGNDTISGGSGNNTVDGGAGDDRITTADGNDTIIGGAGNDIINAGEGNNTITDTAGTNSITAGAGDDRITGGSGSDTIVAGAGNNTINAGAGANSVTVGDGNDTITGGSGNDTIQAGNGDNTIADGGGTNSITTGSGNDTVTTGSGNDTINAGEGNNTITDKGGANTITTGGGADSITGGSGSDTINAGAGNDTLNGGAGNDSMAGGLGDDFFFGGAGNDTFSGGGGNDVFRYLSGSGYDVISDFEGVGDTVGDVIQVATGLYASMDALLAHIQYTGGNAVLSFVNTKNAVIGGITLTGVTGGLNASDFTFV